MDRIVSNANPLIYLAKANKLKLIEKLLNEVFIPEAVFQEVVIEGKRLAEKDAYRIEKAINDGWLKVKKVRTSLSFDISLHSGEIEVISLAKQEQIKTVLVDDGKARSVAELADLEPVGTLAILLQAVKSRMMDFDEFLSILEEIIHCGFYLRDEVYIKVVRTARELSEDH